MIGILTRTHPLDSPLSASVSREESAQQIQLCTTPRAITARLHGFVNVTSLRLSDFTPSDSASDLAHLGWRMKGKGNR